MSGGWESRGDMAVHRDVFVECDFCSESEFADGNLTDQQARWTVRNNGSGFRTVKYRGRMKDICPICYEMKRHKE